MNKSALRKLYLDNRKQLSSLQVEDLSAKILQQFTKLNFRTCKVLFSYSPLIRHQEFNVAICEDHLKRKHDGLITAYPRLLKEDYQMEAVEAAFGDKTLTNQYGITEPSLGKVISPQSIDLVFVPLIAFDASGYRVGYGKGYYDRFLKRCRPDCVSVGFSFFEAAATPEDIDHFDVPLNFCISPLRVYEF